MTAQLTGSKLPPTRERILIMGSPGTGKTEQLVKVAYYLQDLGKSIEIIDLEDKLSAYLMSIEDPPQNITLQVALSWEEFEDAVQAIKSRIKPDNWIGVDRMDMTWQYVQRWFTQVKYKESLASKLTKTSVAMGKKSSMNTPRFDQGSWQVIDEAYSEQVNTILYGTRANVIMTTGIKGIDESSPLDLFGNLGVLPRGQKELGHQPHSVFLLYQRKDENKKIGWYITTAKDLPGRTKFDEEELYDFSMQYLSNYYHK